MQKSEEILIIEQKLKRYFYTDWLCHNQKKAVKRLLERWKTLTEYEEPIE